MQSKIKQFTPGWHPHVWTLMEVVVVVISGVYVQASCGCESSIGIETSCFPSFLLGCGCGETERSLVRRVREGGVEADASAREGLLGVASCAPLRLEDAGRARCVYTTPTTDESARALGRRLDPLICPDVPARERCARRWRPICISVRDIS